ncbi:MAG: glycosyltransferase [Candidatus Bathyarchaeia archaeon]
MEELQKSEFGGARLIWEQLKYFKSEGLQTFLVDLSNFYSPLSIIHKLCCSIRRKSMQGKPIKTFKAEKIRWLFNLFYILTVEFVGKIDPFLRIWLKKEIDKDSSLVLYNYPYGASIILNLKKATKAIYEHNVEWIFYEDKLRGGSFQLPIKLLKFVELFNLRKMDVVFCTNKRDMYIITAEGIDPRKIQIFIPLSFRGKTLINIKRAPLNLVKILEGKRIIGFVGSAFEPNIVAVKNILKIARDVPSNFTFLIMGSVCKIFEGLKSPPPNVIFIGHVDNLNQYLALCDAFVNPKTTSHTGIEIKMFDYLKYAKPIISTEIGGSGFEGFENVIICDLGSFPQKLIEVLGADKFENRKE